MSARRGILLGAGIVIFLVLAIPASLFVAGYARFFYTPSEAMEPTMKKGDQWVAWMGQPATFNRGDIVLVDNGSAGVWAKRVVGLPGDEIQLVDGVVFLNGRPVQQQQLEQGIRRERAPEPARRLGEQFPGEAGPHQIYDTGFSPFDNMPPQRIAPSHLFVMGDNRDNSMDSRVPAGTGFIQGLGQVPLARVIGVPWFYRSWSRFGEAAGH